MQALRILFGNPFDLPTIRDNRLAEFTRDHIERLRSAHQAGGYQAMLAATEAAYTACFGTLTAKDLAKAEREGLTQTTREALAAFKSALPDLEATVRLAFGKGSATYASFFPQGLTEYHRATLTTAPTLMQRLTKEFTTHESKLGLPMKTRFVNLQEGFLAARAAQQEKKGRVSALKAESQETRSALERQLWKNALLLAADHLDQPEAMKIFFDPTRLKPQKRSFPGRDSNPN